MGVALKAENVSIRYITGDFKDIGIKEYVVRRLTNNYHVNEFMAVDGVSFELESGDMLGIIGSNGAGKSTLLKAVAGIMEPTRGKITANGEVAALLELGSGFDGDLTVKENAYLRGAMLGYTKEFMDATYDQIIDFAELRDFEDRPFKQLSSGMKSRLAFSIASLVKPDILILDEVLSVGDGAFQEKSARKMREIISQGATTILVSHSLNQIRELCNKVLWLDHGRQIAFGETQEICNQYEQYLRGEYSLKSASVERESEKKICPVKPSKNNIFSRSKKQWIKATGAALILAAFVSMLAYTIAGNFMQLKNGEDIITILPQELPVTYRGAAIDGVWYSPSDTVTVSDGWEMDWDEVVFIAKELKPLQVKIPKGSGRTITFNADSGQGKVMVEADNEELFYDLSNAETIPLGLPYNIPDILPESTEETQGLIALIVFAVTAFLTLVLYRDENKQSRELWGDGVRALCCFMIVLLHNTCNVFYGAEVGGAAWNGTLFVNSLTAFAVPCFYMISGAYLLRKETGVKEVIKKRIPKVYVPLLLWSCVYILADGNFQRSRFIKMLFTQQTPHLWFIYSMVGIYLLLPFLSKLYLKIDFRLKLYGALLLLIIPGIWHDLSSLTRVYLPNFHFAVFWPDLGLFLCGALLWDMRQRIQEKKWTVYAVTFVLGLLTTMVLSGYISAEAGAPSSAFISCIGSIGNVIMAASAICMALSLEGIIVKMPECMKRAIAAVGTASMGIYFVHILVMNCMSKMPYTAGVLRNNSGSQIEMLGSAFVFFLISFAVSYCGRKVIPIRRTKRTIPSEK